MILPNQIKKNNKKTQAKYQYVSKSLMKLNPYISGFESLDPFANQYDQITEVSSMQWPILKALAYFDIFEYPLTIEEIVKFSNVSSLEMAKNITNRMVELKMVNEKEGFYFINNDYHIIDKRKQRNLLAKIYLAKAIKIARLVYALPFIQCICISGSLSKMDMRKHGDIDYFVICKKNRVWILRLIFSAIIKTSRCFGWKNQLFCPNYIIDSDHLVIRDKNIFTATEAITLMPVLGHEVYHKFMQANSWVLEHFPNFQLAESLATDKSKRVTNSDNNYFLSLIDTCIFKVYQAHYLRKYQSRHLIIGDFELKFNKFESKLNVNGYRNKILTLLELKLKKWELVV